MLENFNAFSQIAHLDFNIPLPHILLPLALSFVTFQQIAFLFDCYRNSSLARHILPFARELEKFSFDRQPALSQSNFSAQPTNLTQDTRIANYHIDLNFIDYALFISFFPQLIAGPIVHHREMMPQFAKMGANSACSDFLGSASAHSLQRTASASHSFASHNPKNSSTILEFVDSKDSNNPSLRDSQRESWQSAGFVSEAKQPSKHSPSLAIGWRSGWVDSTQKSTINYEFLAKGIFIFSIGLFKKVFIADSFAKWANAGFSVVEKGGYLNIAESWATSLSYTFQLYFDFSGYCDMAIGLGLMFGIVLPLNFNSPYKSLNIAEFWRRWHITLGRFLKECLYIPLGGNRGNGNSSLARPTNLTQDTRIANDSRESNNPSLRDSQRKSWQSKNSITTKILTLRNLFIVAFLSGIWHGAGWGFVIWGILHGVAMVIHRTYSWFVESRFTNLTQSKIYKILAWFITFNFINIAWIFFRAENLSGAVNLLKGMFGIVWVDLPQKWHRMPETLAQINGRNDTIFYIIIAIIVCLACRNSFEMLKKFDTKILCFKLALRIFNTRLYLKGGALFVRFVLTLALFYASVWAMIANVLDSNAYTPFLYFNF